jgi:PAS domain S-box-containing protein
MTDTLASTAIDQADAPDSRPPHETSAHLADASRGDASRGDANRGDANRADAAGGDAGGGDGERAAAEARALAERLRQVVEAAADAVLISDSRRRITFANGAAGVLVGAPAASLAGATVADLVAAEQRDEAERREGAAHAGEAQRYEAILVRRDGERRVAVVAVTPLRETGGGGAESGGSVVAGVVTTIRDVTDERRAREALARSEARYRNLFEIASDAIYTLDARADFTSVNRATCEILGRAAEELLGRSIIPFIDPEDLPSVTDGFRAARAGFPTRYVSRFYGAAGARRVAQITNSPIWRDGQVVGILGIARDVTEERARDAALRRSEQRYAHLVEIAWDAIFTIDDQGRFTNANRALERAVGLTRHQLAGRLATGMVVPEERAAMEAMVRETLAGARQRCELHYRHVNGSVCTGSLTMTPIEEGGRVVAALGIVRDVTEERRLGEQLLQREKLAAVGQLVSGVAHELNNPLAGILAFSQLLLASAPANPEQLEALAAIQKEAKRAAKIINNLLLFARQRPPERVRTDLNRVMLDALELRRYALMTHRVEIVVELDPELPDTLADPFQLQQVFLNLITNAEQALTGRETGAGRRLTLRTARAGDRLVASVHDSGPGVPPEIADRIFDPFYTTKPVGEGTGLGLSISDGIVREHGGHIHVESRPGSGARFSVVLPLRDPAAPPDDPA